MAKDTSGVDAFEIRSNTSNGSGSAKMSLKRERDGTSETNNSSTTAERPAKRAKICRVLDCGENTQGNQVRWDSRATSLGGTVGRPAQVGQ